MWVWMPPSLFSFIRTALANWDLLYFHMNLGICFFSLWVMSLGLWWGWHWMCRFLWAIQPFLTVFILFVHKQRGVCPPSSFFFSVLCMIKLWLHRSLACLVGVISRYFIFLSYQWCFSAEFSFNSLDFTFPVVLFFFSFLAEFFLCCWVFIQIDDFSSMFTVDCSPWVLNEFICLFIHSFPRSLITFTRKPLKYSSEVSLVSALWAQKLSWDLSGQFCCIASFCWLCLCVAICTSIGLASSSKFEGRFLLMNSLLMKVWLPVLFCEKEAEVATATLNHTNSRSTLTVSYSLQSRHQGPPKLLQEMTVDYGMTVKIP